MAPRLARLLVSAFVPDPEREFLLGDLDEQLQSALTRVGTWRARRRYWSQALRSIWHVRGIHRHQRSRTRTGRWEMATIAKDFKVGLRTMWRSPGYSSVAIITLALAIGANTLLFSIANPLVVRALPIKDPNRLGWISMSHAERGVTRGSASMPDYLEWRDGLKSFTSLAAYGVRQSTLTGHGDAARIFVASATPNLVDVWGLAPASGRLFLPGEDKPGAARPAVLSFRYWRESFDSDPSAIGRSFFLDGTAVTVVGVMQQSIELGTLSLIDVWTPATLDASAPRDVRAWRVVGRLANGSTIESADAELRTMFATQAKDHPDAENGWAANVVTTTAAIAAGDTWVILGLLGVVVVFVLLIACANLSNLLMARLVARRREFDVRLALGASRWQIVRPLLVEGLVMSVAGGLGGLALAYGGLRLINAVAFEAFLRTVGVDTNVLIFTAVVSVIAPVLFAAWPALIAGRTGLSSSLHGSRTGGSRGGARRRNFLVGSQVAMALALLVMSALTVQSMMNLRRTDIGFDPRPLLTWKFSLPAERFKDDTARRSFAGRLDAELGSRPGVSAAGVISHMPVLDAESVRAISGTKHDGQGEADHAWASWFAVTPRAFDALGLSVLAGRAFDGNDLGGRQPVAILSRTAAERYFDRVGDALGRSIAIHDARTGDRHVTVVGIVSDTRDNQLIRTSPQLYVPIDQWPVADFTGVVRTAGEPVTLAGEVRQIMRRLDADVAVSDLKPLTQIIHEELSSSVIINGLFLWMGGLALALASAGLFGVISYSVGQRRREFGIRLALGAAPRAIARQIVVEGLRVTAIGMFVGLLLAFALARLAETTLIGITPRDPATFIGVSVVVIAVALAASWGPALRAMHVDPARTLRAD